MIYTYTRSEDGNITVVSSNYSLFIKVNDDIYICTDPNSTDAVATLRQQKVSADGQTVDSLFRKIDLWESRRKNWERRPFEFDDSDAGHIIMGGIKFPKSTWAEWHDTAVIIGPNGELEPYRYWLFTHPFIPGDGLIVPEPDFEKACAQAKKWFDRRHPA